MSGFNELNEYINKTLTYILESDKICNLLTYNTADALSKPVIEDRSELIFKNIYPFNYIPSEDNNVDEEKTVINVILEDFSSGENNSYFKKGFITLNILTHKNLWKVNEGFRPFLIMEELESKFNKLHNDKNSIGIGGSTFQTANYMWANYAYSGYSVRYKAWSFS